MIAKFAYDVRKEWNGRPRLIGAQLTVVPANDEERKLMSGLKKRFRELSEAITLKAQPMAHLELDKPVPVTVLHWVEASIIYGLTELKMDNFNDRADMAAMMLLGHNFAEAEKKFVGDVLNISYGEKIAIS